MNSAATRCLIFDPFSGISGDMMLGALIDVGLPPEWLRQLTDEIGLDAEVEVVSVERGAITARHVRIRSKEREAHRNLADILEIIHAAPINQSSRDLAASAFRRLAEVEGAIHGTSPERVHFHEVGAVDAIVDILGVVGGISELGIAACFTRPVAIGRGWVDSAHGRLPLPAPATLKLLEGLPVYDAELEGELTTPTGAVLLAALTKGQELRRTFAPLRSGYGAGTRNPSSHPNCLRVVLAELEPIGRLCMMQADIDDMSPEYLPALIDALCDAGAIDVWTHPVQMKKGRTGVRIELLVDESRRQPAADALLAASSTIGLRYFRVDREVLPRTTETVEWRGFPIRVKSSQLPGGHVRRKVEYQDVIHAARELGIPPLEVRQEIERQLSHEQPQ